MSDDAGNWRRIVDEIYNEGRVDLVDEIFAEDYVEKTANAPLPPTRDGVRMYFEAQRAAFPDLHAEILSVGQDGDTHFGHVRVTGTMTGDFLTMPASGKSATWEEMHTGRFAGGKLVEHSAVFDQLGMLTQLGFIPPMGG